MTITKTYASAAACAAAAANYRWLAELQPPLVLPALLHTSETSHVYTRCPGDPVTLDTLPRVAEHLGTVHASAHRLLLRHAQLNQPWASGGHVLPAFTTGRQPAALRAAAGAAAEGDLVMPPDTIHHAFASALAQPACLYKDSNLRNLLVTTDTITTIDFDDLTLAPFGYDLAKLLLSLALTEGPLPDASIASALAAYNAGVNAIPGAAIPGPRLYQWVQIHYLLTRHYLGRHGYRHSWADIDPRAALR